ncbi:MAG: fimbrillin family protein [Candidatus Cryptobacteroides sp.]
MKKFYLLAAVAGVALVGCAKNEVAQVASDSQKEIAFAYPVLANATKTVAGELGADYSTSENFRVYAVWHDGDFATQWSDYSLYMDDVETAYSSTLNGWSSSAAAGGVTYYWPKNGKLTFAAYSPSSITATHSYGNTGLSITDFQIEASASNQYDLLYSERSYNNISSTGTSATYDGVDIKFKHALSSIQFAVKTAADYSSSVTINLKKISVYGVNSKGDFSEGITNEVAYANTPVWSNQSDVVADANAYVYYDNASGLAVTSTVKPLNGETYQTDLILLPQTLPATAKMVIEYTIDPVAGSTPAVPVKLEAIISTATVDKWEPGKRYTYTITIGLDEIYFAPSVTDWAEVSVDVPTI